MRNEILNITSEVKIEIYYYHKDAKPDLYLMYINEDHLHGDSEELIDISVEQAKDMVKFLQSFIDEVEKDNA